MTVACKSSVHSLRAKRLIGERPLIPGGNLGRVKALSVEVVISPDGRVEVARAVSGHPLLKPAAAEAARRGAFNPRC